MPDLIAGKTTPVPPTMSSQVFDAANLTHCQASSWCFVPVQIESARPLNMLLRPAGPFGSGAQPTLNFEFFTYSPIVHEPSEVSAPLPDWNIVPAPRLATSAFD